MAYNYDINEINKFLSINQIMEKDAQQRSLLISGITRDVNYESILNAFSDYNVTGGGVIQSYEFYNSNKMRITYFYHKDAERVISRGTTYKIGKTYLHVSKFSNDFDSSDSTNSSLVTAIVNSSRGNTPLEIIKPIDQKRILLTNVPSSIDKEYLDLYLEYLSDEVEIERIDPGEEIINSIVVTYSKFIDFENLKKKHKHKPRILKNTTVVLPVYLPNTVVLELENDKSKKPLDTHLSAEILELYFSNKKRSGGHNVKNVKFEAKKNSAFVSFENFETAKQVCNRSHHINGLDLRAKLYYENIGPDPFLTENKVYATKLSKHTEKSLESDKYNNKKSKAQTDLYENPTPIINSPFENYKISSIKSQNDQKELTQIVNVLQPSSQKIEYADKALVGSSDSHQTSYTVESNLNLNDLQTNSQDKPKVNLPSLDDPILSFEEYAILNNITLKPDASYRSQVTPIVGGSQGPQINLDIHDIRDNKERLNDIEILLEPKIESKPYVVRNEDETKGFIIGGNHSTRPISPVKKLTPVQELKRLEIEKTLELDESEKSKKLSKPHEKNIKKIDLPSMPPAPKLALPNNEKIRIRNEEESKGFIIGGSHSTRPLSPVIRPQESNEKKRISLDKKLTGNKEKSRKKKDLREGFIIGGSNSTRPISPVFKTDISNTKKRNEIEKKLIENKNDEREAFIVIGGSHTTRPPSSLKILDESISDQKRDDLEKILQNYSELETDVSLGGSKGPQLELNLLNKDENKFKSLKEPEVKGINLRAIVNSVELSPLDNKRIESENLSIQSEEKEQLIGGSQCKHTITPLDLTPLPEPISTDSKFQEKVDAIKKILEDPNLKERTELENILYGLTNKFRSKSVTENHSITPVNTPNSPDNKSLLKNSIEINKLRLGPIAENLNQSLPTKIKHIGIPPIPKMAPKEGLNTNLNHVSFGPEKPLKPRPFSTVEPSFYNDSKDKPIKNSIINQYGNQTTADSINRLNPIFLDYLKMSSYLDTIRQLYSKININLNENQKRVYFFGSQKQVTEAKSLILKDLETIKTTNVKLNRKELANFLKKEQVKKRLEEKFENFLIHKEKDVKEKSFFRYDINTKLKKETNLEEFYLNVHTNCADFIQIVHEFINKNVMVDLKLEINSSQLRDSIRNEDSKWESFYSSKYEDLIDYKMEFHKIKSKSGSRVVEQKCFLKLTGFKEHVDEFQSDLIKTYKLKKAG
ncbi:unnamed protein product [Brachionus calyciflorus]|uniref:RRM domain-containing protein n=1 Tax=Brachionus calyciflorus TaxID=104777 RepID=A0A813T8R8_9BILA|nr:unnamed protein product [Brachionus calyciflorus]